jgi:hypothetical protein
VAVAFRRTAIGKQNSHLMQSFWTQGSEISFGVRIFEMRLGMALLGVDQIRERGSRMKKTGVLLPTKSQFPSSV